MGVCSLNESITSREADETSRGMVGQRLQRRDNVQKPTDDLDAVRQLAALLKDFSDAERELIIRWTREKLGMQTRSVVPENVPPPPGRETAANIKSFISQKSPRSDRQLAATVAYYHRFVAPEAERKDHIGAEDVIEACRQADCKRPKSPLQTLINAFHEGYLDRDKRGRYKINSVGENLVAMVLPGEVAPPPATRESVRKRKRSPQVSVRSRKPR